jgi:serine/threonine-protein kinase RsbW
MGSKLPDSHTIDVESSTSVTSQVCGQILAEIKANGYTVEDAFAIHLAFEEAFTNAVKHGNNMDPKKHVQIDYSVDPQKVEITITDEGQGFDPGKIPDPRSGKNLYKPEGRGLLLIRSYMDVVEYTPRGNSLRMVRYKEKPALKISTEAKKS